MNLPDLPAPSPGALWQILRDSPHYRRLIGSLLVFLLILGVGTAGYRAIGGPSTSPVDALYMTFITIATIGYSEVVDLSASPGGRLFTMALSIAGIGNLTFFFSTVTAFMLETNLNRAYWKRRMKATIDTLSGHYVVCGAGRIGSYVMDELRTGQRRFVVIEVDAPTIDRQLERDGHLLILEGDASDDDMLRRAGVERAAGVFAVTGDDAKNLVVSLSAKQLNPGLRVVARVHDPRNAAKTLRAGADEIVSPDFTGGHRIASLMIRPQMVSLVDELLRSGGRLAVEEIAVPPRASPLRLSALGRSPEWLVVAVRDGTSWRFNPPDDVDLASGQALVVIASPQGRRELEAKVSLG